MRNLLGMGATCHEGVFGFPSLEQFSCCASLLCFQRLGMGSHQNPPLSEVYYLLSVVRGVRIGDFGVAFAYCFFRVCCSAFGQAVVIVTSVVSPPTPHRYMRSFLWRSGLRAPTVHRLSYFSFCVAYPSNRTHSRPARSC